MLGGDFVKKKAGKNNAGKDLSFEAGGIERKTQIRIKSLVDVRRFMARTLNDLDGDKITESKARTLGYLCSVLRDVIKDSDLESRILKLEKEMLKNEN
jgi:hypothetical protein